MTEKVLEKKVCKNCKIEKDISEFYKDKYAKDGLCNRCKDCMKIYCAENKNKISERSEKYNDNHKVQKAKYDKQYRINNSAHILEYAKTYREKNKEKMAKYSKEYCNKHKEQIKIRTKRWAENNSERSKKSHRVWTINNNERCRIAWQKSAAKRKQLPSTLTICQWELIKSYFGNSCAYCGSRENLQQDHFIPLSKGGEYTHNNIVPACEKCNTSKKTTSFFEWYPKQPFYSKIRNKNILDFLNYNSGIQQLSILYTEKGSI